MIEPFINYIQFERRFSKNTSVSYRTDLLQFQAYLSATYQEENPAKATHAMIRSWIVALVEQKLDASSINRKIACLRSFYKFQLKQENISANPTTKIKILKTAKRLPYFVMENDMVTMLNNHEGVEKNFTSLRDQLIVELLYGTGMRLSELLELNVSRINFHERTLKVVGKRNKERVIPFTASLGGVIQAYLKVKQSEFDLASDYLIVTDTGEKSYPMFIQRIVKKQLGAHSSVEKKSPHVLRHTYATHLLNKGAEINAVKELLGHTSLAATQVYTHNSMEKLKRVFDQAHPKA
jgi:integrase/recombinase XerC